jgi:hypothetical protein
VAQSRAYKSGEEINGIHLECLGECDEFDHVESSFAGFKSTHKRLWALQHRRKVSLGHTLLFTGSDKQLYERRVFATSERFAKSLRCHGASNFNVGAN